MTLDAQWTDRIYVKSETSSALYTVARKPDTDLWGCSCRGWTTHGHCKHLDKLGKTSARATAAAASLPEPPATKSILDFTCPACGHRRGVHLTRVTNPGCTECADCVLIADDISGPRVSRVRLVVQEHRNPKCTNWKDALGVTVSAAVAANKTLGWDKYRWWRAG